MSSSIPAIVLTNRSERQASTSRRNASSPYSLTVPPRSHPCSTSQRADTPTPYLDPPDRPSEKNGTPYLEIPMSTIIVTERPRPYTLNGPSSRPTIIHHHTPHKATSKLNDRVLAYAITLTLALLLAIGIPLGAILPQKYITPLPISVLVPFSLSPESGAWGRLEDAIVKHHTTSFTIVVNPDHGPGNASWPEATYTDAIKRINMYPNVQTLGYVDTAHGRVGNASVRKQIATYAGWANVNNGFALHGVFFDHTPWQNNEEGVARAYLGNVSAAVRGAEWVGKGVVVWNSGHVPDRELMVDGPDVTVVYEGVYGEMPSREELHAQLEGVGGRRDKYAMLVHSAPGDLGRTGLRKIVERIRRDVEWLYVTNLEEGVYEDYPSFWEEWLDVLW